MKSIFNAKSLNLPVAGNYFICFIQLVYKWVWIRLEFTQPPIILVLVIVLSGYSCKHEPFGIERFDTLCYSNDIQPILLNSCGMTGCHDAYQMNAGLDVGSYESVMGFVSSGSAKKSKLYNVLSPLYFEEMMPPDKPLSLENRTLIEIWIEQGAIKDCGDPNPGGGINTIDSVCFVQTILPILQSSCAVSNCHDPVTKLEDYDFSSYSSVMNTEEAVVPFLPNESKIYKSITKLSGDDRMPPFPRNRLNNAQIDAIRKWISQGALNSDCPSGICDTVGIVSFSSRVFPIFLQNCIGCHGTSNPSGNVKLTDYSQIKFYAESNRNGTNMLSGVLNSKPGFANMPPYGKLDKCTIRTIELWIEQGRLNN